MVNQQKKNKMKRNETKRQTWGRHGKSKQQKVVGVKLRTGKGLHGHENSEWSSSAWKSNRRLKTLGQVKQ